MPYGVTTAPQNLGKRKKQNNNNNNSKNTKKKRLEEDNDEDEEAKLRAMKFIKTEDSPEEIAQWIEDRKKSFPTRERVKAKKLEEPVKKDHKNIKRGRGNDKKRARICSFFQRGKCSRGDECLYLHQKRALPPVKSTIKPTLLDKVSDLKTKQN